ncbi:MAG: hypothetical protein QOE77_2554, partial [Blastocatellia bacterium]|nr:hypothetical protein [Blastocatellia bacterium]
MKNRRFNLEVQQLSLQRSEMFIDKAINSAIHALQRSATFPTMAQE